MKQAQYRIAEALRLQFNPFVQGIGGDIVDIHRLLEAGKRIRALCANALAHLVVFVGDSQAGSPGAGRINQAVDGFAFGFVIALVVAFVEGVDFVEHFFLCFPVQGSVFFGSLEEHMLEVMGQACVVGRIILAAGFHGNHRLHPRLFLVHGSDEGESIGHFVIPRFERVAGVFGHFPVGRLSGFPRADALLCLHARNGCISQETQRNPQYVFHLHSCSCGAKKEKTVPAERLTSHLYAGTFQNTDKAP